MKYHESSLSNFNVISISVTTLCIKVLLKCSLCWKIFCLLGWEAAWAECFAIGCPGGYWMPSRCSCSRWGPSWSMSSGALSSAYAAACPNRLVGWGLPWNCSWRSVCVAGLLRFPPSSKRILNSYKAACWEAAFSTPEAAFLSVCYPSLQEERFQDGWYREK